MSDNLRAWAGSALAEGVIDERRFWELVGMADAMYTEGDPDSVVDGHYYSCRARAPKGWLSAWTRGWNGWYR